MSGGSVDNQFYRTEVAQPIVKISPQIPIWRWPAKLCGKRGDCMLSRLGINRTRIQSRKIESS